MSTTAKPVAHSNNDNVSVRPIDKFRNTFAILHNLGREELAGIVTSDTSWTRFNNNLTTFVLKLDDDRLDALYQMVQSRQPARYREG